MTMTRDKALADCPFCGADADQPFKSGKSRNKNVLWDVTCSDPQCGCRRVGSTEAEAVESWNTRAYFASLPPKGEVTEDMVQRAQDASAAYWDQDQLSNDCPECSGTGMVPAGDSQDWCGTCGGVGSIHNGTDDDAMRAALTAALNTEVAP